MNIEAHLSPVPGYIASNPVKCSVRSSNLLAFRHSTIAGQFCTEYRNLLIAECKETLAQIKTIFLQNMATKLPLK